MYVKLLEIENFKSFWKKQTIALKPGFNLFVGANNSGKTSALEVLDINEVSDVPHRSIANLPEYGDSPSPHYRFRVSIATDLSEYYGISDNEVFIPIPENINTNRYIGPNIAQELYSEILNSPEMVITIDFLDRTQFICFETFFGCSKNITAGSINSSTRAIQISTNVVEGETPEPKIANFHGIGEKIARIRDAYRSRIYRFSAQRLPTDTSSTVGDPILQPDAGNLPYCINHLHSKETLHKQPSSSAI